MSHIHRNNGLFSFVVIPFAVLLLLFGIFSIVWLRSSVRTMEYSISMLEDKKQKIIKERKTLMAEKASVLSIQSIKNRGDGKLGLVFPDRVNVIYVKKGEGSAPYTASLEGRDLSAH